MMNSKNCSSNISATLVKESLRRLWILGAFAFAAYFFAIFMPLLLFKTKTSVVDCYLTNGSIAIFFAMVIPVLMAMSVWFFLNGQGSVATFHSLPYSRKQIYNSTNLAGLILTLAPVILTGGLMIIIRLVTGPIYDITAAAGSAASNTDSFPFITIILWTVFFLVINAAIYLVAVTASMISGVPGIRTALTYIFLLILPALVFVIEQFSRTMLYGYSSPTWVENALFYTSPITAAFHEISGNFARNTIIIYAIVSVALYLLGFLAYKKRPLEKAGDILIFGWTKVFLNCLAGFLGATFGALALYYLFPEPKTWFIYLGAAIGGAFCFLAIAMIIQKTPKIKGIGKTAAIMIAILVLFFGAYAVDIFGFESHVPDADEVESVCVQGLVSGDSIASDLYINDPDFINEVRGLHSELTGMEKMSYCINNGDSVFRLENGDLVYSESAIAEGDKVVATYCSGEVSFVELEYKLKNGRVLVREYPISTDWLKENEHAKKAAENKKFKEALYEILTWNAADSNVVAININPYPGKGSFGKYGSEIHEAEKMQMLVKAVQEDLLALPAEKMNWCYTGDCKQVIDSIWVVVTKTVSAKELSSEYKEVHDITYDKNGNAQVEFWYLVDSSYTKTIALLKEWGVYDLAVVTAEDVDKIKIVKYEYTVEEGIENSDPVVIKDKDKIREVLETSDSYGYNEEVYYEIEICDNTVDECSSLWYYYTEKTVPSWLKALFK